MRNNASVDDDNDRTSARLEGVAVVLAAITGRPQEEALELLPFLRIGDDYFAFWWRCAHQFREWAEMLKYQPWPGSHRGLDELRQYLIRHAEDAEQSIQLLFDDEEACV